MDSRKNGYVYDMVTTSSLNWLLEITAQFDDLAMKCSEELIEKKVQLEPQDKNYDVPAICRGICSFMQSRGFSVLRGRLAVYCK